MSSLFNQIAPAMKPYIDIDGLDGRYYYEKLQIRDADGKFRQWHPKAVIRMHRPRHPATDEILYAAIPQEGDITDPANWFYLGASQDGGRRFWRGKPTLHAPNYSAREPNPHFHHADMRKGRDGNLEQYLQSGGKIRIYTATATGIKCLPGIAGIAWKHGKYFTEQVEKTILAEGYTRWKWNSRA